jgi:hypothetical protein
MSATGYMACLLSAVINENVARAFEILRGIERGRDLRGRDSRPTLDQVEQPQADRR